MKKIQNTLKQIAKNFNLRFNKKIVNYLILTKREILLRNFIGGCPDPEYNKFGKIQKLRIKNIESFVNSDVFKKQIKNSLGCVICKQGLKKEIKLIENIKDNNLKNFIKKIYSKIKKSMGIHKDLILIFKHSKKEKKKFKSVLTHELIHQLLEYNNLGFQKINKNSWKWNEGLVIYIDFFSKGDYKWLDKKPKQTKNKMWDIYQNYAHHWGKILNKAKSPKERKKKILNKYNELKK